MEIQEFLHEHQYDENIWDKKEKIKKSFDDDNEKMKILTEIFDYNFDSDKLIEYWGLDFKWEGESFKILEKLCGDYADLIKKGWVLKEKYMYQNSYLRRSFRAPNNKKITLNTKINWINQVYNKFNYDFDLKDYVKYCYGMYDYSNSLSFIFASAIESGQEDIYKLMLDIVYGRSDQGKIDSNIIKTLLLLDRGESREAISKLLLSAQRQEGLRQTILEVLDEAHPNNLKYMMNIIIENDLSRFSSVVRAFNVWTGLNWEEPRKKTVERAIELGLKYLNDNDLLNAKTNAIDKITNLKDNFKIYMALWACGVNDIEKTYPIIDELLKKDESKKAIALYFMNETQINFNHKIKDFLNSKNLTIAILASKIVNIPNYPEQGKNRDKIAKDEINDLKKKILNIFLRLDKKPKLKQGVIFSWFNLYIDREYVMGKILNLSDKFKDYDDLIPFYKDMSTDQRYSFASSYLQERRWGNDKEEKEPLTENQRKFVIESLADRSTWVQNISMNAIERIEKLKEKEVQGIEKILKRKSANLRKGCLEILSKQDDDDFLKSGERLIQGKTVEERTAGLDILIRIENKNKENINEINEKTKNKISNEKIAKILEEYKQRKKITIKEKALMNTLESKEDSYSLNNGFGLYDPKKLKNGIGPELKEPFWISHNISDEAYQADNINEIKNKDKKDKNTQNRIDQIKKIFETKENKKNNKIPDKIAWYSYSLPFDKILNELKSLDNLIEENKDVEYKSEDYSGGMTTYLLGNYLRGPKWDQSDLKDKASYEEVVLFDTWNNWFKNSPLTPYDVELITCTFNQYTSSFGDWIKDLDIDHLPGEFNYQFNNAHFNYSQQLFFLLQMFKILYSFEDRIDLCLRSYENFIGSIPKDKLNEPIEREYGDDLYWQDLSSVNLWSSKLTYKDELNNEQIAKLWNLKKWSYDISETKNSNYLPKLLTYAMAYEKGIISKEDIYFNLFVSDNLSTITSKPFPNQSFILTDRYPFLKDLANPVIDRILEIELKRGDSPTSVSQLISHISKIEGIDRFFKVLVGLEKETFVRNSYYGWGSTSSTKRDNFSKIIRILEPQSDDTKEKFKK